MKKTICENLIVTHDEFHALFELISDPGTTSFQDVTIDKIKPHPTNPEQHILINISCENCFTLWYIAGYVGASVTMAKMF
jgi:hypothetical protein